MNSQNYLDPLVLSSLAPRLRDLMGNCSVREAAQCCMAVASAIQNNPKQGPRLMGLACAFLIAAEQSGISVTDMMAYARNCMNDAEGKRPEFAATADYINKEIINNG